MLQFLLQFSFIAGAPPEQETGQRVAVEQKVVYLPPAPSYLSVRGSIPQK